MIQRAASHFEKVFRNSTQMGSPGSFYSLEAKARYRRKLGEVTIERHNPAAPVKGFFFYGLSKGIFIKTSFSSPGPGKGCIVLEKLFSY